MWKRYHVSIEGIRKGFSFTWKVVYKWGLDLGVEPPCLKVCWVPPTPSPRAGMLFVPAQKLSVIEWVYSLSSHTLRYGFSLLKSKYWSFVYLQLCLSGSRTGWFYYTVSAPLSVIRGMNTLTTQNEGNRRRKHILLSCFVLFRFICFYMFFFFLHQDTGSPNIAFSV